MLLGLTIRDVVLIDRLTLAFRPGLCVLTGETGAGKSILLDALGLALGKRADASLVRPGAEQAAVIAEFAVADNHPALTILREAGVGTDLAGTIVLRRLVGADGRSRAFVNDEPASVGLLRELGDALVEIQGQGEQRGLLDPATHRALLDAFAEHTVGPDALAAAWRDWRDSARARRRGGAPPGRKPRRGGSAAASLRRDRGAGARRATRRNGSARAARCCRTRSGSARRLARRSARSRARPGRSGRWRAPCAGSNAPATGRRGCSTARSRRPSAPPRRPTRRWPR